MADKWFTSDFKEIEELQKRMEEYGAGSGQLVDSVLHREGAQDIKEKIAPLIPRSGRKWKGKGSAAADAMPRSFRQENGSLSVTIAARGKYGYLYFPDDGSNTRRHAGNLQFMRRGAEAAADKVIERCIKKLIDNF